MSTVSLPTSISTQQTLARNTTYVLTANTTVTVDVPFTAATDGLGVVVDGQGYALIISGRTNYTGTMNHNLDGAIVRNMTISSAGSTTLVEGGSYMFKSSQTNKISDGRVINCLNTVPLNGGPDIGAFFGSYASNCVASNCGNTGALNTLGASGMFAARATSCLAVNCYNNGNMSGYSGGMYGSYAVDSIASNCYNTGTSSGSPASAAIFAFEKGNNNYASNCYSVNTDFNANSGSGSLILVNSSYNASWVDSNAVQFLTGTPILRSELPASTIGSVWYSRALNTPYTLYSQIPVQNIPGGTLTSPTLCNLAANTIYRLQGALTVTGYNTPAVSCPFRTNATTTIFDASGYTITVANTSNVVGLFSGGATILNLTVNQINSTLCGGINVSGSLYYEASSWIFCRGSIGAFLSNCTTTSNCTGGYVTSCMVGGHNELSSALNCTNYAPPNYGIFGIGSSGSVTSNCANMGGYSSGMFGEGASFCTAKDCINTGPGVVGGYQGGFFGGGPRNCTAINCINTVEISPASAADFTNSGIFGWYPTSNTAINCYNTGTVGVSVHTAALCPPGGSANTITNCYTTNGPIAGTGATLTSCSSNAGGIWRDATASSVLNNGNGLTGVPALNAYPTLGTVWYSASPNTPYLLTKLLTSVPCFVAGTRILTPTGYRRVETLETYDEVVTSDGRTVRIKLHKTKIVKTDEETAPYVIPKDAFGVNNPDEDLHVSGKHVIRDGCGKWQIPMHLLAARQYGVGSPITYYHIECPDYFHDDLVANGAVVESFRNNQGTSELSYTWNEELRGYTRIMEESLIYTNLLEVNV